MGKNDKVKISNFYNEVLFTYYLIFNFYFYDMSIFIFKYEYVCAFHCACVEVRGQLNGVWTKLSGQLMGVSSHLLPCGPWDWTQVPRLGGKHFHPLSHLAGPYLLTLRHHMPLTPISLFLLIFLSVFCFSQCKHWQCSLLCSFHDISDLNELNLKLNLFQIKFQIY